MRRVRNVSRELIATARAHRQEETAAEKALWSALRRGLLGVRFRRQHPVGTHILDFYCPAAKLVIEVDGDDHDLPEAEERARSQELAQFGYAVIRFLNDEITRDIDRVLTTIRAAVETRLAPEARQPLPQFPSGSRATEPGTAPRYAPARPPPPSR
jgi:very-short-patch-repair endonuclease